MLGRMEIWERRRKESDMLEKKHIILGVTGSIAAYKSAMLASLLVKQGADVTAIMTKNGTNFINPITFETLTGNKCLVDTFDRNFEFQVEHVSLAAKTDLAIIAPATANFIGKMANGIADDMLTTTLWACRCPIIVAPAMNTRMYENAIVFDNLEKLRKYGFVVVEPASGKLACGDVGKGKMPEPDTLLEWICHEIGHEKDMAGRKVLITSGPTREAIDPVRFITNHSTGKMGHALARSASTRGAEVEFVTGRTEIDPPMFVNVVPVVSAGEMAKAVKDRAKDCDIVVCCAAVADFRPAKVADEKLKKDGFETNFVLEKTEDILSWVGENRFKGQQVVGFSMETENVIENSRKKLEKKKCDMIVANNLRDEGAGFGTDTNVVTLITKDGARRLPIMSKEEVANESWDQLLAGISED